MTTTTSIQLIRNATVVFNYGGKQFLIDPMLAEKGAYPGLPGTPHAELRNPLVDLPIAAESLLHTDAVILTHLHPDHWDAAAVALLPKDKTVFTQNEADAIAVRDAGFSRVQVFGADTVFEGITFRPTEGQHGSDEAYAVPELAARLGKAAGIFFNHPGSPSVYFVGDTIWIDAVAANLQALQPDIVVLNAGNAQLEGFGAIIMGKEDVGRVRTLLPDAVIVAIHMEALNHCLLSREALRAYVSAQGISGTVLVPEDGELLVF